RSKKSLLQRGLRAMNSIFVGTCFVHQLWEFLRCVGCYGLNPLFALIHFVIAAGCQNAERDREETLGD
ncbi:MAG: hypothetical protein LBF66_00540, partial [Holosporales bacterium]|nr:hypothetical protein [Holosporales bacterium]